MQTHLGHGHAAVPPVDVPPNVMSRNCGNFSSHSGEERGKCIQLLSPRDIILHDDDHIKQKQIKILSIMLKIKVYVQRVIS